MAALFNVVTGATSHKTTPGVSDGWPPLNLQDSSFHNVENVVCAGFALFVFV